MSDSISDGLYNDAKLAIGRLGFDISVDKKTCIRQLQRVVGEIGEMISALDPAGKIVGQIIKELKEQDK